MAVLSLLGSKAILAVCNFLLLTCGFLMITGGMLILLDEEKILLSRLLTSGPLSTMPQPFLFYVGIGLAAVGLLLVATGILGCWASCMHSYYMLTPYFLIIMVALVGECAVYATAWAWPNCLGLEVNPDDLTRNLKGNYGNAGHEQFTAAIDLAQTFFNCCGVETANEYDTSIWRLQPFAKASLAVPLTCCKLQNYNDSMAYLNPVPLNSTLCQALEPNRHKGFRHLDGCDEPLQQWYRKHYLIFLGIGLVAVLVEFLVLLSTILTCTRIYKHNQEMKEVGKNKKTESKSGASTMQSFHRAGNAYSNETYATTNSFRQNYKLVDRL